MQWASKECHIYPISDQQKKYRLSDKADQGTSLKVSGHKVANSGFREKKKTTKNCIFLKVVRGLHSLRTSQNI